MYVDHAHCKRDNKEKGRMKRVSLMVAVESIVTKKD